MKPDTCIFVALFLLISTPSFSQGSNPFVEGFVKGKYRAEFNDPRFVRVAKELKEQTKSDAALYFVVERLLTFKIQTKCGRVKFWIEQPATQTKWEQLGGELNICEDGLPPWGVCANNQPAPVNGKCADGSPPQQTAEVKEAIQAAVDKGGSTKLPKAPTK